MRVIILGDNPAMDIRVKFREADKEDIGAIVELLVNDVLGVTRERCELPLPQSYFDAYGAKHPKLFSHSCRCGPKVR